MDKNIKKMDKDSIKFCLFVVGMILPGLLLLILGILIILGYKWLIFYIILWILIFTWFDTINSNRDGDGCRNGRGAIM